MKIKQKLKTFDYIHHLPILFWVVIAILVFVNRTSILKSFNPFVELTYTKPVLPQYSFSFPFPIMVDTITSKNSFLVDPIVDSEPTRFDTSNPMADTKPFFAGGNDTLVKFIRNNVQYPKQAIKSAIAGIVTVQFILNEKGKVLNPKITKGIGGGCDEEVIRLVKLFPVWNPARENGRPVKAFYSISIAFTL
jgi:TonB family protein